MKKIIKFTVTVILAAGAIVDGIIGTLLGDRIKKAVLLRRQWKTDRAGS
jgi:hypothetical protein